NKFSLNVRDEPAQAALRDLLRKADGGQQLVYVFRQQGGEEWIEIISRKKAQERGDRLPPELRTPLDERLKQPVAFHTEGKQPITSALDQFSRDMHLGV